MNTLRLGCIVALAFGLAFAETARAEDPIATELSTAEGEDYIGLWKLTIDLMGRPMDLFLNIADVNGKLGATLDSKNQPEPLAIAEIVNQESGEGLQMNSSMTFFGRITLDISIDILRTPTGVEGMIQDRGGILKSEFTGASMSQEDLDEVQGRRPDPTEARINVKGKRIRIAFAELEMGNSDWDRFNQVKPGEVFTYTLSRAHKMYTDWNLVFGETIVKTENITEDYPGVYSLWMRKGEDDRWTLIFNEQPDIWGTRRLEKHDVAEVPLEHSTFEGDPVENFAIELSSEDDTSGTLTMKWGNHQWTATFGLVQ